MSTSLRLLLKGADRAIKGLVGVRDEISPKGTRKLDVLGTLVTRGIQRGIREQRSPGGAPYRPVNRFGGGGQRLMDTGKLLRSLTYNVMGENRVVVGTDALQAATMHFGDPNRRPKNAKALAIPLTRAIARAYIAGTSLRQQYPNAFIFKSATGGVFLVQKNPSASSAPRGSKRGGVQRGAGSNQLQFLFKLMRKVSIPPTPFMGVAKLEEELINETLTRLFRDRFEREGA